MFTVATAFVMFAAQQPSTPLITARLKLYADSYSRRGQFSGVIIALKKDRVIFRQAYGYADIESRVKNSFDTKFCIASVTKPITIAATIQMINEGKLQTGDQLSKFIPTFPRGNEITLLHLLGHRAGIPHRVTTSGEEVLPQTAETMAKFAAQKPLLFTPGERSSYTSAGFSVLARVLEIADKKPYSSILTERIFKPAGMNSTFNADPYCLIDRRALSYNLGKNVYLPAQPTDFSFLVGAGSIFSTADDLVRFAQAVFSGKLGDTVRNTLVRGTHTFWNGLTSGFRCSVDIDTKDETILVICSNVLTGAVDEIRQEFKDANEGKVRTSPYNVELAEYSPSVQELTDLEGSYKMEGTDTILEADYQSGYLFLGNSPLVAVGKDKFFSFRDFGTVRALRDSTGHVTRITWETRIGGRVSTFIRAGRSQ